MGKMGNPCGVRRATRSLYILLIGVWGKTILEWGNEEEAAFLACTRIDQET
jgi:hypothetical protein